MKMKKSHKKEKSEKNGLKLIIIGIFLAILSYPIPLFILSQDSILKNYIPFFFSNLLSISLALVVTGFLERRFKEKLSWYYCLLLIIGLSYLLGLIIKIILFS